MQALLSYQDQAKYYQICGWKVVSILYLAGFFIIDNKIGSENQIMCTYFWSDEKPDHLLNYLQSKICPIKNQSEVMKYWDLACFGHSAITPIKNQAEWTKIMIIW